MPPQACSTVLPFDEKRSNDWTCSHLTHPHTSDTYCTFRKDEYTDSKVFLPAFPIQGKLLLLGDGGKALQENKSFSVTVTIDT